MQKLHDNNIVSLSVFIIAKNEADRIHLPINSVKGLADEIVVVDSGSSDNTMEVAKNLGADKVLFHEWSGYGPQKAFAESVCRNNWLLNLDADEAITPELAQEIRALFAYGEPKNALYAIKNVMVFPYETKPRRFSPSGYFVRLYNRQYAGFKNSPVHDSVVAKTQQLPIIKLKHPIHHSGFRNFSHMIEKMNNYTSMQAADMFARNRKVSSARICIEPIFAFFKSYFGRGYFRFGAEGVIYSLFYSFNRTIRLAKLRELYKIAAVEEEQLDS